jgi:hypothetical protein
MDCELIKRIKSSHDFSLKVGESTDTAGSSIFLEFVRYVTITIGVKRKCLCANT